MDSRDPRQNSIDPRHQRDPRHPRTHVTHATHEPTQPRNLADSCERYFKTKRGLMLH